MDINECRWATQQHIEKVRKYIRFFTDKLTTRGVEHDKSKLEPFEAKLFAEHTENLKNLEFGSKEYEQSLEELKPALEHHYTINDHHPQFFGNDVSKMDLLAILEMLADWKASCERTKDGDIIQSIEINAKRFNIDDQLKSILINTVKLLKD